MIDDIFIIGLVSGKVLMEHALVVREDSGSIMNLDLARIGRVKESLLVLGR